MIWGLILGGALGALCRYGVNLVVQVLFQTRVFPWATFAINIIGSFGLAFLFFANYFQLPHVWRVAIGTGFLGAFTTFSTFELETLQLMESGKPFLALLYVVVSVMVGFMAALLGRWLALRFG
jgi:fluoride exporter